MKPIVIATVTVGPRGNGIGIGVPKQVKDTLKIDDNSKIDYLGPVPEYPGCVLIRKAKTE